MQLRLGAERIDAFVWRLEDGDYLVDRETLALLNIHVPGDARIRLSSIPGLEYRAAPDEGALVLRCASACYETNTITGETTAPPRSEAARGAFLNLDLTGAAIEGNASAAAHFDLGFSGGPGFGGISWIASANQKQGAGADMIRLTSHWTIDDRDRRTRLTIGDSILRSGFDGGALRIGGVQWGADFSIDPNYQSYPLPAIRGEAATPSVVELYEDGLLRMRRDVAAGPFEIRQAPVMDGAGRASVVVRDALGRERIYSQSFYVDTTLLRANVADYTIAAGAERYNFGYKSDDYRNAFAAGRYRYGVTHWLTAHVQSELSGDGGQAGAGAAFAVNGAGRFDVSYARSNSDSGMGEAFRAGWRYLGEPAAFGYAWERATADYWQLGRRGENAGRTLQSAFLALNPAGFGSASLTWILDRNQRQNVQTLGVNYSPPLEGAGDLQLNFARIEDARAHYFAGLRLTVRLGGATAAAGLEHNAGGSAAHLALQSPADPAGGWGWSAAIGDGDLKRLRLGADFIGARSTAQLEAARSGGRDGFRGSYQTSLVFIGGRIMNARPIRGGFALVDAGAPDVDVLVENRRAGKTDFRGRFLVTDLRPYETNRISIDVNQLPLDMPVRTPDLRIVPAPRTGVIARFDAVSAHGGEIRIVDDTGAPLPLGSMVTREDDGERFPIGRNGRAYISGLKTPARYSGDGGCAMTIWPDQIAEGRVVMCKAAGL